MATRRAPSRFAVSISCTFIRKPASPQIARMRRSGCTRLAAIAPGNAKPIEQKPLGMRQVLGSWHW
jgi:hypothetical protein